LSFDLAGSLRRLKPQKRAPPLLRRRAAELPIVAPPVVTGPPLLLDTTVYIDALQSRLPTEVEELLDLCQVNHSAIAVAELSHAFGRLDPGHARTKATLASIQAVIEAIPPHRLDSPSLEATVEAGILAGLCARLRGLPGGGPQTLLNDAALLLQARENGWRLLSRNIVDLDLLQQLAPGAAVLFYRQAP